MTVFDFPLYDALGEAFGGGSMEALSQDAARGVVHERPEVAVTFAQNHDTVGPGVNADQPEGWAVELAEAFLLAYAGMPMLYRSGPDARPELEDETVRDLVAVSQAHAHGAVLDRYVDEDSYVFERESNVLAGINTAEVDRTEVVETSWTDERLVDATGDRDAVATDDEGRVEITVPAADWITYAPEREL